MHHHRKKPQGSYTHRGFATVVFWIFAVFTFLVSPLAEAAQSSGLVAAYGFNESSGTSVIDASGSNNNGTLGSGVTWTTTGKFGGALVFNGSSGLVTIPNSASLQLTTGMTLEAWVNPSVVTNKWRDVIYKGNDNYYLEATSTKQRLPAAGGTFKNPELYGTVALVANTWTHLAATYDRVTLRLYVNGVQVSSLAATAAIATSTNPLQIGGDSLFGQFFQGMIDEVRVYNVALTVTQIQDDMNTPVGGTPPADTAGPAVAITSHTNNQTVTTSPITVSGTASDSGLGNNGISSVTVNGVAATGGTATGSATANWSRSITLSPGTNTITVVAKDNSTNQNATTVSITVTYNPSSPDTAGPAAAITSHTNNQTVTTSPITVSGTASDSGLGNNGISSVTVNGVAATGGTATGSATANWSRSITLSPGTNTITVVAKDNSTNQNATTVSITVTYSATQTPGLVAAYGFNESSGTSVIDASGSNNNGTLGGGVTRTTTGKFGGALVFNGTSGLVTIPNSASLQLTTGMTLEAWVNPSAVTSAWRDVIYKGNDNYYLEGTSDNGGRPGAGGTFGGVGAVTYGTAALAANTWTHLAVTYDGTNLQLYANGAQVSSLARTGNIATSTNPLQIGGDSLFGQFFQGMIDEVRVYNVALTVTQIQDDMNTPVGANGPRLIIMQPANGTTITGSTVAASYTAAGDLTGVDHVHFKFDNGPEVMDVDFDGSYQFNSVPFGSHLLQGWLVRADHSKIDGTDASVTFNTIAGTNDTTPPSINITAPTSGSTVLGTTTVAANAEDDVGVVGVQFFVDGVLQVDDTTPPYSFNWSTTAVANGNHTLTARARDAAGNQTTSSPVNVTVSNGGSPDPAVVGQWAAPFNWPIVSVHAHLLRTGEVMASDGQSFAGQNARVWNPTTNTFTSVNVNTSTNPFCSGHCQLPDGRILIVGGHIAAHVGVRDTNIFNPATRQWTLVASMHTPRWYPTNTVLPNGQILVTAGEINCDACNALIPEIYNPVTNSWTELLGAPLDLPYYPHMFVLPDGRVLAASTAETPIVSHVLDINTQTWSVVDPNAFDGGSAAMYLPGKIIKSGTSTNPDDPAVFSAANTYVLDMTSGSPTWRETPSMAFPRAYHTLTLLPDGTVLATGGGPTTDAIDVNSGIKPAELWSPVTETWTTMASMQRSRLYHSIALLLPDARVLIGGGGRFFGDVDVSDELSGEIFSPPYLFKGARPVITSAPAQTGYGSVMTVQTPDAAQIGSVALVKLGSVTHAFNMDQRYVPLFFTTVSGGLSVQTPANGNIAPPGYYMLFIVNTNGVPSVATILNIQ